jgi:triacylglycerol lipase
VDHTHHIFLVPGFFGFADLGDVLYFAHVVDFLPSACAALGVDARVHAVPTLPTASVRRRAERLLEWIAARAPGDGPIDLIGHSSGGLDARLLVTPGGSLRIAPELGAHVERIRTVTTVAAPNHGTPVATFFNSYQLGQQLLRLLSLGTIYALGFGRLPISVLLKLGAVLARMDSVVGWRHNILDQLYTQLLDDFSPERRHAVERFLGEMGADQALLPQLTPEGIDVFNAATGDRPGVRYGSVISYARPPGALSVASVGLDPYGQATHALFAALYRLASRMSADHLPSLEDRQLEVLFTLFGIVPGAEANDGVVPTLSQIWGEIVHATRADHLDVLGHFGDARREPPHYDWLSSGSGFGRTDFEWLWTDVARFIAGKRVPTERAPRSRGQHLLHLFSRRGRR